MRDTTKDQEWQEHNQVIQTRLRATTSQRFKFWIACPIGNSCRTTKDARYWFTLSYSLVCVIGHRVDIIGHDDATLVSRGSAREEK